MSLSMKLRRNKIEEIENEKSLNKNLSSYKVAIGIPLSWHYVPSDFLDSCLLLMNNLPCQVEIIRSSSGPIHEMRNVIIRNAVAMGCSHLMFLDADMVYPPDTISKLLAHDLPVVGALTFRRWPNFDPLTLGGEPYEMVQIDPELDTMLKVTATGAGCLMIKTEVFDRIEYPWFSYDKYKDKPVGEDINFCYKAGAAGYEIFVDTSIRTEHLCNVRVNWNIYRMQKDLLASGKPGFTF